MQKSRTFMVASIGSMVAVFVGMINLVTIRDVWIMVAVIAGLAALTVLAVRERIRQRHHQSQHRNPPE